MLGLKLNHVSKRGYWCQESTHDEYGQIYYINAPLHDTYNHNKTKQNRTVVISYELAYTIILLALREKKTNNVLVFDYGDTTWTVRSPITQVFQLFIQKRIQTNHKQTIKAEHWCPFGHPPHKVPVRHVTEWSYRLTHFYVEFCENTYTVSHFISYQASSSTVYFNDMRGLVAIAGTDISVPS